MSKTGWIATIGYLAVFVSLLFIENSRYGEVVEVGDGKDNIFTLLLIAGVLELVLFALLGSVAISIVTPIALICGIIGGSGRSGLSSMNDPIANSVMKGIANERLLQGQKVKWYPSDM